jgi:hypothetical protein
VQTCLNRQTGITMPILRLPPRMRKNRRRAAAIMRANGVSKSAVMMKIQCTLWSRNHSTLRTRNDHWHHMMPYNLAMPTEAIIIFLHYPCNYKDIEQYHAVHQQTMSIMAMRPLPAHYSSCQTNTIFDSAHCAPLEDCGEYRNSAYSTQHARC